MAEMPSSQEESKGARSSLRTYCAVEEFMKSVCRGLKASSKLEGKIAELQSVSNEVNRCLQGIESNIQGVVGTSKAADEELNPHMKYHQQAERKRPRRKGLKPTKRPESQVRGATQNLSGNPRKKFVEPIIEHEIAMGDSDVEVNQSVIQVHLSPEAEVL